MLLGWYPNALQLCCRRVRFHDICFRSLLLSRPPLRKQSASSLQWAARICFYRSTRSRKSSRVRGRGLPIQLADTWRSVQSFSLSESFAPFDSFLAWPVSLSLSNSIALTYCFAYVPGFNLAFVARLIRKSHWVLCAYISGYLSRLGQGRNNRAIKSDQLKLAPKRLHITRNQLSPSCRDITCQEYFE